MIEPSLTVFATNRTILRGWRPGEDVGERSEGEVLPVEVALSRRWSRDHHFACYAPEVGGELWRRSPRLRKIDALTFCEQTKTRLVVTAHAADLDRPGHAAWGSFFEGQAAAHDLARRLPTAAVYSTAHGLRVVQPLREALDVEVAEGHLMSWLHVVASEAEGLGVDLDMACKDWTRWFRLPFVVRTDVQNPVPSALVSRGSPIAPYPSLGARKPLRPSRAVDPTAWTSVLTEAERALVAPLAKAVAATVVDPGAGGWHVLFLRLAGALLVRRRCRPEALAALIGAIATAAGDTRVEDRIAGARTTVERRASGAGISGDLRDLPLLQRIVFPGASEGASRRTFEPDLTLPTADEAGERMLVDLRRGRDGVTLVCAEPGVGKTHAVRKLAAERAAASGKAHRRTGIAVPTNELAKQITRDLRDAGVKVVRVFGPLSVRKADGSPVCAFAGIAAHLANGGLSVRKELCDGRGRPCQYAETCPARAGEDADEDAAVVVGTHAKIGEISDWAGSTGIVAVDEPPSVLETATLRLADLEHAWEMLGAFDDAFARGARPALAAALWWMRLGECGRGSLRRCIELGERPDLLAEAGASDSVEAASGAGRLKLKMESAFRARTTPAYAEAVGRAAKTLRQFLSGLLQEDAVASLEQDGEERSLGLTLLRDDMAECLRREGQCLVLSADVELYRPHVRKIVGYEPPIRVYRAREPVEVDRVWVRVKTNKRTVLKGGEPDARELQRGLALAARARVACENAAIVSYKGARPELERQAAPFGTPVGHYGALRGLDAWKGLDGIITIGDPWPNLGEVRREVEWLDDGTTLDERAEDIVRAELEQVHGRLRLPRRTRPATLIHVGTVQPNWPRMRVLQVDENDGIWWSEIIVRESGTQLRPLGNPVKAGSRGGAAQTA